MEPPMAGSTDRSGRPRTVDRGCRLRTDYHVRIATSARWC